MVSCLGGARPNDSVGLICPVGWAFPTPEPELSLWIQRMCHLTDIAHSLEAIPYPYYTF